MAELACSFTSEHVSLEAIGSDGTLLLSDPWHSRRPVIVHDGRGIRGEPADAYRLELENLADAVQGVATPLLGREDALGQARALEALYRWAETGRPVAVEQTGRPPSSV